MINFMEQYLVTLRTKELVFYDLMLKLMFV